MSTTLIVYLIAMFTALLLLGFICNFVLFRQDRDGKKSKNFFTSERLLIFFVEILIAVIGFGATLFITNAYERQIEKEKAMQMIEQVITYTEKQAADERSYLRMYDKGEIDAEKFLNSSVVNSGYYESILTNDFILQNADMNIHGETRAHEATEPEKIRAQMYWRYAYFLRVRSLLLLSYDELSGTITQEEATEEYKRIIHRDLNEEVKLYEKKPSA